MLITRDDSALSYLKRIGYYRLSAYWYPFREFKLDVVDGKGLVSLKQDTFKENTHFSDATKLYVFDKKLRLLAQDALARVEISVRVDVAHLLGKTDVFAHHNQKNFHPKFATKTNPRTGKIKFIEWQEKYNNLLRRSNEDFVKHYQTTHGKELPIWVAIEIFDFGALSQLFSMMKVPDQEAISKKYGVKDFKVFSSWLRSLNYLRNIVAHHSRLWNRNIIDQPKLPALDEIEWCNKFIGKPDLVAKPFLLLALLRHLVKIICPNTEWHYRLHEHLQSFPEVQSARKVDVKEIGFVDNWEEWWKK